MDKTDESTKKAKILWDHFGRERQLQQLQEECAELIVAISHYRRGKGTMEELSEELLDLFFVAYQFMEFDQEFKGTMNGVDEIVELKIDLLVEKIKNESGK